MANNRGSAVAIVLLILGVSSLVGVALLSRTKLDVQVSSSVSTYDRIFGAADGGSTVALMDLKTYDRTFEYNKGDTETNVPPVIVQGKGVDEDGNTVTSTQLKDQALLPSGRAPKGYDAPRYTSQVQFTGFTTDPGSFGGWEVGEFYPEYWRGEGKGKKSPGFLGTSTESKVHSAVTKMKRKM
jgi:hypothetical protein